MNTSSTVPGQMVISVFKTNLHGKGNWIIEIERVRRTKLNAKHEFHVPMFVVMHKLSTEQTLSKIVQSNVYT